MQFYEVLHEEGNNLDGCKPGTMTCIKCRDIVDHHFTFHLAYIEPMVGGEEVENKYYM